MNAGDEIRAIQRQLSDMNRRLNSVRLGALVSLPIAGTDVELEEIGAATYDDVQDWVNLIQSAGKTTTGDIITIHLPADGSVDIVAGTGFIKTTDSPVGLTKCFDWGATNLALVDNKTNYIYIDYNAGAPEAKTTITRADIEMNRHFTLGRVYRAGNAVHVVNSGTDLTNTNARNHERLIGVRGFERDSGGVISEVGARFLESTAGIFWLGANRITTIAQDTSGADRFTSWYHAAGNWASTTGLQQVDNTRYDDGADLQNLTPNKYGTMWCYIDYDSHLHVVYGLQNGTLTQAQAADPPEVPAFIRDFAILAARLIIQEGAANIVEIEQAFVTFFPHTTPSEHVDLGGLQGGTAGEYYHLTNAEHIELAIIAALGRGIADNNLVQIDSATVAALDYARFTANGLEGRSYAEVLSDLSGQAAAAFDWNSQDLTNVENISGNFDIALGNLTIGSSPNLLKSKYSDFQSFEDEDDVGSVITRGTAKCDTADFYIGDRSLRMVATAANSYVFLGSSNTDYNIRLKPSTKYIVSYYAKAPAGTPRVGVYIRQDDGVYKTTDTQNITTSWARCEFIVTTDAGLTNSGILRIDNYTDGATVWFDALQVEEASAAASPEASPYKPGGIMARKDVLKLKERATPPAEADHGKVYTKNDNKLYFQDGAGVEHEISLV